MLINLILINLDFVSIVLLCCHSCRLAVRYTGAGSFFHLLEAVLAQSGTYALFSLWTFFASTWRHSLQLLTDHNGKPLASLFHISDYLVPTPKNDYYAIDRFLPAGAQHKHDGLPSVLGFQKPQLPSL